jgi:type IV secretion system protein TrbL
VIRRCAITLLASGSIAVAGSAIVAPPAQASIVCGIAGYFSGIAGKVCNVATGPAGGIIKKVLGGGASAASHVSKIAAIAALGLAAFEGAKDAVKIVGKAIGESTSPRLTSTWFSASYWRMTLIAALLTLPFLFAAAVQALMRSDLSLLVRAAVLYLPLGVLASAIAAPLTMLLLAASDEMSSIVSSAAGTGGQLRGGIAFTGLLSLAKDSPVLLLVIGMFGTMAALAVWLELAVREAAVYVIVLMLPLMFAAIVWPARRVWAVRAVETLIALILSKFVIVAILALGARAIGDLGVVSAIAGIALLILAAFSPWMLVRLLPMAEVAGAAAGSMGGVLRSHGGDGLRSLGNAAPISNWKESAGDMMGATRAWMAGQATDGEDLHKSGAGRYGGTGGAMRNPPVAGATGGGGGADSPAPSDPSSGNGAHASGASATGNGNGNGHGHGTSATGTGANATGSANGAQTTGERLPGLGPVLQAPDGGHRELVLGHEEYPSPRPVIPLDNPDEPDAGEHKDPLPERQPDFGED